MAERALAVQAVNVLENRPEIGRRLPDKLEMFHILRQLTGIRHLFIRAELVIALQNTQIEMPEKAGVLLQ